MKYAVGDKVICIVNDKSYRGIIAVADFGGAMWITSIAPPHHTYDIWCEEEKLLIKHIPEIDIEEEERQ
jgi:hypothetical protein